MTVLLEYTCDILLSMLVDWFYIEIHIYKILTEKQYSTLC